MQRSATNSPAAAAASSERKRAGGQLSNTTQSPGFMNTTGLRRGMKARTGVRPMTCQPLGPSIEPMAAWMPPITIEPAGTSVVARAARNGDRRVEAAKVGEARQEADHEDFEHRGHVPRDDFGRVESEQVRNGRQVEAVVTAVDHRNAPRGARCRRRQRDAQGPDFLRERGEACHQWIIEHQQRA